MHEGVPGTTRQRPKASAGQPARPDACPLGIGLHEEMVQEICAGIQ